MNDITAAYAKHIARKLAIYSEAMKFSGINRVIIGSGSLKQRFRDDLNSPYFASPYFNEFVPLGQNPNSFLVIEKDQPPVLFLQHHDDYWHSAPASLAPEFAKQFDIKEYVGEPDMQVQNGTAYIGADLSELSDKIAQSSALNPETLLSYVDYYRAWKTDYEQHCLREANSSAAKGHIAAERAFKNGCSEYEIHMAYLSAINSRECELPYDNIVALNEHAAVLHHFHLSSQRPPESKSFLIDAGANFQGYGSDVSRTHCGNGEHEQFAALINSMDKLQKRVVDEVRPGKSYVDIHKFAHYQIAKLLCDIGILKCSPEEAVETDLTIPFFPHGVGHLIGVQVHDKGGYMVSSDGATQPPPEKHESLRCTRMIEENMTFTIEPGLYFIPSLLAPLKQNPIVNHQMLASLIPYGGIRIEDNVLVKSDSVENFTRTAFGNLSA